MQLSVFDGICGTLNKNLDSIVKVIEQVEKVVTPVMDLLDDMILDYKLRNLLGSKLSDFENAVGNIADNFDKLVPQDLDAVTDLIQSCPYLSRHPLLNNPATAIKNIESELKNGAADMIQLLNSALDWGIAIKLDGLNTMLDGFRLSDVLKEYNDIVTCLNNLCGTSDITAKTDKINNILQSLGISSNGSFNLLDYLTKITDPVRKPGLNLDEDDIATITIQYDSFLSAKQAVADRVSSTIDTIKTGVTSSVSSFL